VTCFERRAFKIFHRKKSFAILFTNVVDGTDVGWFSADAD
jgi:hypothetical protein